MTTGRRDEDEPTVDAVEHDFATPEDADLTDDLGGGSTGADDR